MNRSIYYYQAIKEALYYSIKKDKKTIVLGLGADDPKGIFGTTLNLKKIYPKNIFDAPTAENSMTGIALGLATKGYKCILIHQRVEFSLLSLEQVINQVAKWHYMSAGQSNLPIVIRLIIGKGWGQGPQHSQSLETLFAHIPGLKVVAPSNPLDAKSMLIESILDPNPVIFFEHRWLHNLKSHVPKKFIKQNIKGAKIIQKGNDLTVISYSNALVESIKACNFLKKNFNIKPQLIDLRVLRPLDKKTILRSINNTQKILLVDNGMKTFGITSEISAIINEEKNKKFYIRRIGIAETPIPSSIALAKYCYPEHQIIVENILQMLKIKYTKNMLPISKNKPDQPDSSFKGPF